jgi:hypothetical protein
MNIHYDYMFPMSEEREMHAFLKHNQAPLYWASPMRTAFINAQSDNILEKVRSDEELAFPAWPGCTAFRLKWALASQGPSQAAEARKSFEDLA